MVKGVNKNIIEIQNPDSLYFEKAVLYVRPNVTVFPEAVRRKEAERLLHSLMPDKGTGKRNRLKKAVLAALLALFLGIVLFLLL
ncbi:hypothetical protein [Ruminococcus flavefaciens]|uniref:hypothetical protein n=1 Tax=Ruminococcus flavefaciens TaxID=1265 RepID=UPI000463AD29|nr:hypothetical protein [Ruminococcus flavefaciens]